MCQDKVRRVKEVIEDYHRFVEEAIETYDHLLWEALIRKCAKGGEVLSRAFGKQGQSVRVVYRMQYDDPRQHFEDVRQEVSSLITKELPVAKTEKKLLPSHDEERESVYSLCSQPEYLVLFAERFGFDPSTRQYHMDHLGNRVPELFECNFVVIGKKGFDYICCPCNGRHLANTAELDSFQITLEEPKKVGGNTYEFRFSVQ